jgi:RimJ/RimL family protein N-acetyltransferase
MLSFRKAAADDVMLYFKWANDAEVRRQSYQTETISLDQHKKWFDKKINDTNCLLLVFENEEKLPVGQIRFQKETAEIDVIGISLANEYRGKGYAAQLLQMASDYFLKLYPGKTIYAYIKNDNAGSIKSFSKANFVFEKNININGTESVLYVKK